jgi:hypothetical protein
MLRTDCIAMLRIDCMAMQRSNRPPPVKPLRRACHPAAAPKQPTVLIIFSPYEKLEFASRPVTRPGLLKSSTSNGAAVRYCRRGEQSK